MKIIHTTISDCENERRIFNEALTASRNGYEVKILSLKTPELKAHQFVGTVVLERIAIRYWQGGPLKFLSFNFKLFIRLLFEHFDILHVHDLWVLPASALVAIIRRKKLIYDTHEYYRGLEIFNVKPFSGKIWSITEKFFIRFIDTMVCVNPFHADLFLKMYPEIPSPVIIMNLPRKKNMNEILKPKSYRERENTILFQGIFKPGRGLFQVIKAMRHVNDGYLEFIGFGELEEAMRQLVDELELQEKIMFRGKVSWDHLLNETQQTRGGLVIFEPTSENYRFASPNKFFEYVMAGTPVIASNIPTFRYFLSEFEVGLLVDSNSEEQIADAMERLLSDEESWNYFHLNCLKAREVWNWEIQEEKILDMYKK